MPAEPDPRVADPWLRAALQRPAGPGAGSSTDPPEAEASSARAPEPAAAAAPENLLNPRGIPVHRAERTDPSRVRRLAVQGLYVLGAEPDADRDRLLEALEEPFDVEDEPEGHDEHPPPAREAAVDLALAAWAGHAAADAAVVAQVPAWPTRRQPPVDRAILRLAHHELVTQRAPVAVVIDEAVELAKAFGEDRTPGFVNAVLDAVARGAAPRDVEGDAGEVRRATGPRPAAGAAEARRGKRERFNAKKAEMAAKVGPKRPRDAEPARTKPERPAEPVKEPGAPADPWAAAARRKPPTRPD